MWGQEIHGATVQGGFTTSNRELAQEILMFTSEASTLGSSGRFLEEARQELKGWEEDRGIAGWGRAGGVSTGPGWFFGAGIAEDGTVGHHSRAAINEIQDLSSRMAPLMASVGSTDLGYSVSIRSQ